MSSLRPIYNYPVVPEESERYLRCKTKPVSRAELKCDLRTSTFVYSPNDKVLIKAMLDYGFTSTTYFYNKLWIRTDDGEEVPGGMETIQRLADAGIYLHYMGLSGTPEEVLGYSQFFKDKFGERYLGGKGDSEFDGGYTRGWGWPGEPLSPDRLKPGRTRIEAHEEYDHALDAIYSVTVQDGQHRQMSICSLGYGCHYAAEHETRMLGVETVEKLPSDMILWCFCRGASKQYDLLTSVSISSAVDTPWGGKEYHPDGRVIVNQSPRGSNISGADFGFTEGLSKREWYAAYMYGSSIVYFQGGYVYDSKLNPPPAAQYEAPMKAFLESEKPEPALLEGILTPLGRLHVEAQEFVTDHPLRGVPYMPVALMLDYDHGWNQARHLYRKDEDHVWGNIPYSRLDYQIDNLFRWVYPGYEHGSYYRDERGYITNTPYGDLFEIILSNASLGCLEKYRAVVLLGDLRVEDRAGLGQRLTDFLEGGGIVVTGVDQGPISASISGIPESDVWKSHSGEVEAFDGRRFREASFEYRQVQANGGQVLLRTSHGDPLVIQSASGKGRLYLVTARGWGKNEKRHEFLKGIRHALGGLLEELNLVEIEGRDIFYVVNVTDREDEVLVTLCNNSPDVPWEGKVRIKGEEIEAFEAWLGHSEACLRDGELLCAVPANDVRIFKLKVDRGFLRLMFRDIDWKKLGVGVPEVDLKNHPGRKMNHF